MHVKLELTLKNYRYGRRFEAERYLVAKSTLLNNYFSQSGIKGCIVGVSGGVDSAVALGLLAYAARQPGSPIEHLIAGLLPMHAEGATHQDTATSRGAEVAEAFKIRAVTIDLSETLSAARKASLAGTGNSGTAWSAGQLVSYLRTPMLYYQAALLAEKGCPAVVCGTTNRDEGSYIGFFGKASDGMVDIQPISDLHKSEVYQLAELLGVPESVRKAVPSGDTYDGLCDEEMIGTSYDFLELYTWYLCANKQEVEQWMVTLPEDARSEFETCAAKLELLHKKNAHKYIGDSPAVHLDLHDRAVPGGWRTQESDLVSTSREAALAARVGPVDLRPEVLSAISSFPERVTKTESFADFGESAVLVRGVLSPEICSELLRDSGSWKWVEADRHGRVIRQDNKVSEIEAGSVGSYRTTAYDEDIAARLWERLAPALPTIRTMTEFTPTDWNGYPVWRPIGVNPMLRFIRYEAGGTIVPHYDAGYDFKDNRRYTLMSVVLTLTAPSELGGGNTRLLLDMQRCLPLDERNYEDWTDLASARDVLIEVPAGQGDALVFDHRVLHDASMWQGTSSRIILRTDVVFERCAPHAVRWQKPSSQFSPEVLSEKWARDPTYRKAYEILGGKEGVVFAGYFDDGLDTEPPFDPRWPTAPLGKILHRIKQPAAQDPSKELVVLVNTGALCPIHIGHIEMMNQAKRELETRGKVVLGGIFAPDHDSYVSSKCGRMALSAAQRVALCEQATQSSDWLIVDHWAAIQAPTDVNFTTIIDRIQKQLAYQVRTHRPIQAVYVCGSDNASFALSFVGRGSCVCVLRPKFETSLEDIAQHPAARNNPRITFSRLKTSPSASRDIRSGNFVSLPDNVKEEYIRLCSLNSAGQDVRAVRANFYMRHEGNWAVEPWTWLKKLDASRVYQAYQTFCSGVVATFEHVFPQTVHIIPLHLESQQPLFHSLAAESPLISLDPCFSGTANLSLSRCFEPLGTGHTSTFVARPGSEPLAQQLSRIPNESFVLFDDDTFSGRTAHYAQELLESRCIVTKFVTLCDVNGPFDALTSDMPQIDEPGTLRPRLNHVDCRDFLAGSREAGLVLRLSDGSLGRAPYILPYVRPHYRASVPVEHELEFSRRVWELNREFFKAIGSPDGGLKVKDTGIAFRKLCELQGLDTEMEMEDLCGWHGNFLKS